MYRYHYLSIVISDTFQIISTCGRNSPLICGENAVSEKMFLIYSDFDEKIAIINVNVNQINDYFLYHKNQHMILDTCGTECLTVDLGIGSDISDTARTLDILVIFSCLRICYLLPSIKEPILIYYVHNLFKFL